MADPAGAPVDGLRTLWGQAAIRLGQPRSSAGEIGLLFAGRLLDSGTVSDLSEAERCYQKAIDEDPEEDISYIFVSEVPSTDASSTPTNYPRWTKPLSKTTKSKVRSWTQFAHICSSCGLGS